MAPSPRPPLTDSPWFWAYLFCTAGLVALFLANAKFGPRQAQIERQFQARERSWQIARGEEPSGAVSDEERTIVTLTPLFALLALALLVAWGNLWYRHFRPTSLRPSSDATVSPAAAKPSTGRPA